MTAKPAITLSMEVTFRDSVSGEQIKLADLSSDARLPFRYAIDAARAEMKIETLEKQRKAALKIVDDLSRSLTTIFMMADGAENYEGSAGARLKGCLDEATEALTKTRDGRLQKASA